LALGFGWLSATGCVTEDTYKQALHDGEEKLARAQADAKKAADELAEKLAKEKAAREQAEAATAACQGKLDDSEKRNKETQGKLDGALLGVEQLRKDLTGCGKKAKEETGELARSLAETKAALEEARKAKAAAEARAAFFKQLTLKFQKMIDAGSLSIVLRNGRMVLQMSTDVLFDSGKTEIKSGGQAALKQLAAILKTIPGRNFQVAGHTDNVAIHTAEFPSNWELSTSRAVNVVRFLVAEGMTPDSLSAAGYGEFDPVVKNTNVKTRGKNRRIEITLQPDISELIDIAPQK
jgi:chemotaxis protein MotB